MTPDPGLDRWLAEQRSTLLGDITALLDVEVSLREALLTEPHAALVEDLRSLLDIEAGLAAVLPGQSPPVDREPSAARSSTAGGCDDCAPPTSGSAEVVGSAPARVDIDANGSIAADCSEQPSTSVGEVTGSVDGESVRRFEFDSWPLTSALFEVQRARSRWRMIAAAALILVVSVVALTGTRGLLGNDLRTRPGDEPVTVAETDSSGPTSTAAGDQPTDTVEGAGPDVTAPSFSPNAGGPPGALPIGSDRPSGVTTTESPEQESPPAVDGGGQISEVDWGEVSEECGQDYECLIDAAGEQCQQAGSECWTTAASTCGDDFNCRYMLFYMCGATPECGEATIGDPDPG